MTSNYDELMLVMRYLVQLICILPGDLQLLQQEFCDTGFHHGGSASRQMSLAGCMVGDLAGMHARLSVLL